MDEEIFCALALSGIEGIGPRRFASLIAKFGSAREAFLANRAQLKVFWQPGDYHIVDRIVDARNDRGVTLRIERLLEEASKSGIRAIALSGEGYPLRLREIPDPPPVLWVYGRLKSQSPRVAVVGTRRATPYGRRAAADIARELAVHGVEVVSGLAHGIDTSAHEAVVHSQGVTIAVLGQGIDLVLSSPRGQLAQRIVDQGGALVSEYAPGIVACPHHFPARNRIISGLSEAVVVVEAPEKSGSLITAACALEQGRDVLTVPGSIYSEAHVGCHELLKDGAALVTSGLDVLRAIGVAGTCGVDRTSQQSLFEGANDIQAKVYAAIGRGPATFEEIAEAAGLSHVDTGTAIGLLEIRGLIRRVAPGTFERTRAHNSV